MNRFYALLAMLLVATASFAAAPRHNDQNVNSVNREPMRSSFIVYPSVAEVQ